ncbi:bromodomain-containing protein DDB_G0270170 isoform X1 [Lucilia sericata]|uniref:bromodomain-containing protein DDB_G0270170 isoform X1 n=1 Tax=Lucilia sericata TaxID=13632 RepID=UPI0018A85F05|nr:bromodomain-containing protein DDB_G0270170 isoform X1 [Lucilia sericata]XP_037827959.1 bromodomain-containing protein DDB_G0270170 isoform X1 [Lucilia sericata]XP_037827960.1 bromodomain-containing protein DDB_G0270170 isoform X1 [Lucilia sericata]XP_037827961.1 bromodomain-containing protein DDB_G0270170 isoform X1 [Lucilia sericata]
MASQGVTANSRLAEMQMKFQKKQMLEREQKKLALTVGDISQASKTTIGNGKVRQMFDDRRRGVGIDRSHPLRPIATSTTSSLTTRNLTQQPATNKRPVGGANVSRRVITNSTLMQSTTSSTYGEKNVSNGNSNIFNNNLDELDNIDNETFPKEFSSLSLNNTHIMGSHVASDRDFDNNSNEENNVLGGTVVISKRTNPTTNGIKLNPVITKKSPITTATKTTSRTPSTSSRVSTLSKTTPNSLKSPLVKSPTTPSSTAKSIKTTVNKTNSTKPATFILSVKPPPRISTPPPGMAACQYCQRNFNEDRLAKHEDVCKKMTTKKRKIFDASKHRVKGTEAEKYIKKGKVSSTSGPKTVTAAIKKTQEPTNSGEKKSSWRKKHEEFIAAIREAKKVQAYLAKGGKLSDLPPPPPSENPDYIQCPHCSRRFNQAAAERHIPKCANMQHNKPKPVRKRV